MFDNIYKNKTVLINGRTGFKGSWLAIWLKELGADVARLKATFFPAHPSPVAPILLIYSNHSYCPAHSVIERAEHCIHQGSQTLQWAQRDE